MYCNCMGLCYSCIGMFILTWCFRYTHRRPSRFS
jgi:hypothetical protein